MTRCHTLILGGVRSGKSRFAEQLAMRSGAPVTVVATATAGDDEMRERIDAHRARRPSTWRVVEEPVRLARVLAHTAGPQQCVLVDCLTLWLTNLLADPAPATLEREREALLAGLPSLDGQLILVGNETSLGVVPATRLSRRYCDEAGRLHQALARHCDRVVLTVAGLPQILKGGAP